ncbi:MAG: YqeG family HAD IIIA-type phosphatase [Anaerolineae bacterium]|nr:YqeG family HAD IIIA-type phosphatase [Anaerolineae bacterium]
MLKPFVPNLLVHAVHNISLDELRARDIRGLLFDLDNTLLAHYGNEFTAEVTGWIQQVRDQGFQVCIVSNGPSHRTLLLADKLGVPGVPRSGKPRRRGLRRALDQLGLTPAQAAMVGDQIFTDVWAGNRLGLYTILVAPIEVREPWFIRIKRLLEVVVLRLAGVRERG